MVTQWSLLLLLVLWVRAGVEHALSSYSPSNVALRELATSAFIYSWPVGQISELQELKTRVVKDAIFHDSEDCAKKLLCGLAGRDPPLQWDEELLLNYYNQRVDYSSDTLFFNIAVKVGKDGFRSCTEVYPRCLLDLETLLGMLRRQHISFHIPGQQRDCEVFLLWTKKKDNITRIEN